MPHWRHFGNNNRFRWAAGLIAGLQIIGENQGPNEMSQTSIHILGSVNVVYNGISAAGGLPSGLFTLSPPDFMSKIILRIVRLLKAFHSWAAQVHNTTRPSLIRRESAQRFLVGSVPGLIVTGPTIPASTTIAAGGGLAGCRGVQDRPSSRADADEADRDRGALSPSAHDEARAGAHDLSVSAGRDGDHAAQSGGLAHRSAATWTSITTGDRIRALTAPHPIKPTSGSCRSA